MLPSNGTNEIPTISSACLNTKEDDPIPDLFLLCLFCHHSSWKGHSLETKPHGAGAGVWLWKWRSLLLTLLLLLCIFSVVNVASLVCRAWPRERRVMRVIFLFLLLCGIRCFRIFRGSSAKCGTRGRIGVSASAGPASLDLSQFRFKWLLGSVFWKCYPCRELGTGGLGPLAMER